MLLLGGTYPYGGAIIMATLAAVKSGAGLVSVGTDRENIPALHSHLPEAMAFSLQDQQLLKEQLEKAEVVCWDLVYETMLWRRSSQTGLC